MVKRVTMIKMKDIDIIYPHFVTMYKGWYIYEAKSPRDIPYKIKKKGKRTFFAESIRDIKSDIDNINRR